MSRNRSRLLSSPPFAVENALRTLGANLRTARLRRNISVGEMSEKLGVNPKSVLDAEKGKASTSIGIYVALLWALDLLDQFYELANPEKDTEGRNLAALRDRSHAYRPQRIDNDF